METNQNPVQENPAQRLALELEQPAERFYDPAEAARIVQCLTDGYFDPEYILLFGKLVGGTPHSDAMAYDLLVVVRETPEYDWMQTKRILRYKVPYSCRKITYINLYIMTLSYVESNSTPFLFFAHAEGELLYCSDSYHFQRPKHPIDFAKAYADAKFHFDTFRTQGNELLEQAQALSARAVICVWPRSSRRRQWSISITRFTTFIMVWSSTAMIRLSCTIGCGRFPRS